MVTTSTAAAAMTEADLERAVRRLLDGLGLFGFHPYDSRRSQPGWPDWAIIGRKVLYRELKSEHGRLTSEQRTVGYLLTAAGQDWAVWRPSDLLAGRVAEELAALSRPRGGTPP